MNAIRVGGACKWTEPDGSTHPEWNLATTTVRYVASLDPHARFNYLYALVKHNLRALKQQIQVVGLLPAPLRFWRIGSDVLPLYTHDIAQSFYEDVDVQERIEQKLKRIGRAARTADIRLSFHPGQYVVLGSQSQVVRENALAELEYHGLLFHWMGYRGWHPNGLAINVHVGPKHAAVKQMRKLLKGAPDYVRNLVTLENDEFSWSTRSIVDQFGDIVPVVLDVHHHWIHEGKRIQPDDSLVEQIRQTWRGVQPKLHLAMSDPDLCTGQQRKRSMSLGALLEHTTKSRLRAHSLHPWHTPSISYAASFGFDILWEGKDKNVGAAVIANHLGLI